MSKIIYLKDVLKAKETADKNAAKPRLKKKLKPFKYDKVMESSLVSRKQEGDLSKQKQ